MGTTEKALLTFGNGYGRPKIRPPSPRFGDMFEIVLGTIRAAEGVGGMAIHAALCRNYGYRGSYSAVRRLRGPVSAPKMTYPMCICLASIMTPVSAIRLVGARVQLRLCGGRNPIIGMCPSRHRTGKCP